MRLEKINDSNTGQKVNQLVLVMTTTDLFSLRDFIDSVNDQIGHAVLFQSNAGWNWAFQLVIKILEIFLLPYGNLRKLVIWF